MTLWHFLWNSWKKKMTMVSTVYFNNKHKSICICALKLIPFSGMLLSINRTMEVRFMYKYRGGENANYIKQEKTPWYCHCYIHAAVWMMCYNISIELCFCKWFKSTLDAFLSSTTGHYPGTPGLREEEHQ